MNGKIKASALLFFKVLTVTCLNLPGMMSGQSFKATETGKYIYSESFEYGTANEAKACLGEDWYFESAGAWGTPLLNINSAGDDKYLHLGWLEGRLMRGYKAYASPYTFSGRFKAGNTGNAGGFIFIRTKTSPFTAVLNSGGTQVINEYENDGYDDGAYAYGVGATGVYIKLQGTKLQIGVKTSETVNGTYTKGIGRKYMEVPLPGGINAVHAFIHVTVTDNGSVIKISAENMLMGTVEYSNSVDGIFKNAVLKDAECTVIHSMNNARIADTEATFAITNRGSSIDIADLRIEADAAPSVPRDASLKAPRVLINPNDDEYQDGARLWQGIPGIEVAKNGRIWTAWYSGSHTEDEYNWVVLYTSTDGVSFAGPAIVIDPEYPVRAFDPVLWTDPDGRLWVIWNQSYYYFDGRAGVWAMYTDNPGDANPVWHEPRRIANGIAMNKPVVLNDGTWMLPTAVWGHSSDMSMGVEINANVYISKDKGGIWSYHGSVKRYEGNRNADENMVVQLADNRLLMLIRTMTGIEKSYSEDEGRTWSDAVDANLTKTVSRFHISKLKSGNLLLIYNKPPENDASRSYLTASISYDGGETWQGNLILDERDGVSYPDAVQDENGMIYITYDRNRSTDKEILMAAVAEEDIEAGRLINGNAKLKVIVNNNGYQPPLVPEDLKNTGITPADGGRVAVLEKNKSIFLNRPATRVFLNLPEILVGKYYIYSDLESSSARIDEAGDVYMVVPRLNGIVPLHSALTASGFERVSGIEPFLLFVQQAGEDTVVYHKACKAGEDISFGNWAVIVYSKAAEEPEPTTETEKRPQTGDSTHNIFAVLTILFSAVLIVLTENRLKPPGKRR